MMKPTGIATKLKYIGGILSFIVIVIININVYMNDKTKKDSLVINIAGKQRMLSQKMSKEIFYIKQKDSSDFRELNSAVDTFDENLNDLIDGSSAKGIYAPQNDEIKNKLLEVKDIWIPFKDKIEFMKSQIFQMKPYIQSLTQKNTYLLNLSDDVVKVMVKENMEGVYIDFSGRQRMLSQRMGLFMERYLRTDSEDDYLKYKNARDLYESTLLRFTKDENVKKLSGVKEKVEECYNYWIEYREFMDIVLKDADALNEALSYVYEKNVKLLNTMDNAVWLYTEYSESKTGLFDKIQYVALGLVLLILLYTFVISKEVMRHLDEFVRQAKALEEMDIDTLSQMHMEVSEESEDELKEATSHISNFVAKVNSAMNHSQDAISKAEAAVRELQFLADDVEDALAGLNIDEEEKNIFDRKVNATEDIAIESAENLLSVKKMLEKLQTNLNTLIEKSETNK